VLLRQDRLSVLLRLLTHLTEEVVPARSQGGDSAGFLVLRSAYAVPSVDVEEFALQRHLLPSYQLVLAQLLRVLALRWLG